MHRDAIGVRSTKQFTLGLRGMSFVGSQAQTVQVQFAMFMVSTVRCCARHHDGRDTSKALDEFARLIQPTHVRVTGREKAVGGSPIRIRRKSLSSRSAALSKRLAKKWPRPIPKRAGSSGRVQTQTGFEVLDRKFRVSRPKPQCSAPVPRSGRTRIEV